METKGQKSERAPPPAGLSSIHSYSTASGDQERAQGLAGKWGRPAVPRKGKETQLPPPPPWGGGATGVHESANCCLLPQVAPLWLVTVNQGSTWGAPGDWGRSDGDPD